MFPKLNAAGRVLAGMLQQIDVRAERCNRMCHKYAQCTLCETNCPVRAISVGEVRTNIEVDWEKCTDCGICVNVCPTGVFSFKGLSYLDFLKSRTAGIADGVLEISCNVRKKNDASVKCLGVIGVSDILYFYTSGASKIMLSFGDCAGCVNRYGREIVEDEVAELVKMAAHFEHLEGLNIVSGGNYISIEFPKLFERKEVSQKMSRRDMLGFFRKKATDSVVQGGVQFIPQDAPEKMQIRQQEIPVKRRLFLQSLLRCGEMKGEITPGSYFYAVEISPECKHCKLCSKMCPSGAIAYSDEDKSITVNASKCTSCGMCRIVCRHGNIKRKEKIDLQTFYDNIVKTKPDEEKE